MFDSETSRELRRLAEGTTGEESKKEVPEKPEECEIWKDRTNGIFSELGITEDVAGFKETFEAIIFCLNNEGAKHQIKNLVYPALAKMFGVGPDIIMHRIQQAIKAGYEKPDARGAFKKYCTRRDAPTNEQFIMAIVTWIQYNP